MFRQTLEFTLTDALDAKREYEKVLQMAEIKLNYIKDIKIHKALNPIKETIEKTTMNEVIALNKAIKTIDKLLDDWLANNTPESIT